LNKKYKPPKAAKAHRRKSHTKAWFWLFLLVSLGSGVGAGYWYVIKPRLHPAPPIVARAAPKAAAAAATQPAGQKIILMASGDSIAYTSINDTAKQANGSYDYTQLLAAMKPIFAKGDIRFCSQGSPTGGIGLGVSGNPSFNAPFEFAAGLEDSGCNLINLATRETYAKGQPAIDAMLGYYDKRTSLLAIGGASRNTEEQAKIRYFTIKGLKFAFLAYTMRANNNPSAFGVNVYSEALADAQIKEAKANAPITLVSMGWGTDYSPDVSAEQEQVAQHLAAQNADIILGHGPHVVEPVKVLEGANGHQTLVWYSLGNFLGSQLPVETLIGGVAIMDIDSATQRLSDPRFLPTYMHYEWTAAQKKSEDLAARKNFKLLPLDQAASLLATSQNATTVEAQQARLKAILTKFLTIRLITSADL
jgi:poly-gamma-glutamate synthesis protein (capsule biosynthesis protein)